MFVWARIGDEIKEVANIVDKLLYEAGVFLTPGFIFGKNGDRYIRISLCSTEESLMEAYNRIEGIL